MLNCSLPPVDFKGRSKVKSNNQWVWETLQGFKEGECFDVDKILTVIGKSVTISRRSMMQYLRLIEMANLIKAVESPRYSEKSQLRNNTTVLPTLYKKTHLLTKDIINAPKVVRNADYSEKRLAF